MFSLSGLLQAATPFKADHHALLLCTAGQCRQTVGIHTFALEVGSFMLYTPGLINAFEQVTDDFAAYLILFQQPFLANGFLKEAVIDELLYISPEYKPVFTVDAIQQPAIQRKFADATIELQHRNAFHLNMIRLQILELLYDFNRVCEHCLLLAPKRMNRQYQLTHQFKQLIESNFVHHKTVSEYADQMNVSVKYLSEMVKLETGLPALDVIHNRLLLEAQYLLSHTRLSIKEITDQLGFDTPSHFARFFRHKLDKTPQQYRLTAYLNAEPGSTAGRVILAGDIHH